MNATSASFDTFVCNDWPLAKCCAMAAGPDGRFVDNCISLLCSVCEPKLFPKKVPPFANDDDRPAIECARKNPREKTERTKTTSPRKRWDFQASAEHFC